MNNKQLGANLIKILSIVVIGVAVAVTIGWIYDIDILKQISPTWVTMKLSTALSFLSSGFILYLMNDLRKRNSELARLLLPSPTIFVLFFMGILLVSSLIDVRTGIEDLFVREDEAVKSVTPGRPSLGTMVSFMLIVVASLASLRNHVTLDKQLSIIGLTIAVTGGLAIVGYIVDLPTLYYAVEGWSTAMALHTAIMFVLLGTGIAFLAKSTSIIEIAHVKHITIRSKLIIIILTSILPLAVLTGALNYAYVEQEIMQGLTTDGAATNSINHIKYMTITSIVTVVTLATLLSLFFAKSISIPILKLRDTSKEIAKGNLDVNMQVSTNDEIGQLASQFDMMRQNIKRSNELLVARTLELEKANQLLSAAEQKYRNLYEGSPDLYRTVNTDGIILDCNTSYAEHLGYSKNELIGTSIFDTTADVSVDAMHESLETWKSVGHVSNREIWLKRKDGTTFPALISATSLFDENNKLVGSNTIIKDISEMYEIRKDFENANRELKRNEQDLKELARSFELQNISLDKANSALKQKEEELEKANEDLRQVDKLKDEFASMVTHELKTPLVPIQGYCELLLDGAVGDLTEQQKEKVQIIHNSALRLTELISAFLDIQMLGLGKVKFEIRETSANDLIDNCIKGFKIIAEEKNISLQAVSDAGLKLNCDARRILQVLNNLVGNAIKFVPEKKGKIEICARRDNGSMLFTVKDNGIGISKEKEQNLFKKFYQVDSSLRRKVGGTGLGLAISKEIVEAHKGKIWVESEEGKGSAFYFSIPVEVQK